LQFLLALAAVMDDANTQLKVAVLVHKTAVFAHPAIFAVTEFATPQKEKLAAIAPKIAVLAASMVFAEKMRTKPLSTVLENALSI